MTSDLLFSVLPREGKVPIAHDSQKVMKIDKQDPLRTLSDEEKVLEGEEREARKKQQEQNEKKQSPEPELNSDNVDEQTIDIEKKKPKGPKHLDVYV